MYRMDADTLKLSRRGLVVLLALFAFSFLDYSLIQHQAHLTFYHIFSGSGYSESVKEVLATTMALLSIGIGYWIGGAWIAAMPTVFKPNIKLSTLTSWLWVLIGNVPKACYGLLVFLAPHTLINSSWLKLGFGLIIAGASIWPLWHFKVFQKRGGFLWTAAILLVYVVQASWDSY
ncbi:hypothetical protein OZX65_00725 [Leuconostocaceae bacterium ESL0723]|nr:hypothetical protein OZX65_00725 [Leuconostocaceae bacterium ESL0723]